MRNLERRLDRIEREAEERIADRLAYLVDHDPAVRKLWEQWHAAALTLAGPVPADYEPRAPELMFLRRQHPAVKPATLVEFLWRRDQALRDDPALDAALCVVEDQVKREILGPLWKWGPTLEAS